jgi:hypothetical protein
VTSRLGTGKPLTFFHSVLDKGSLAFHGTIQCPGIMLDTPDFNGKIDDVCELKQLKMTTNSRFLAPGCLSEEDKQRCAVDNDK